jgi:hypothetical protein
MVSYCEVFNWKGLSGYSLALVETFSACGMGKTRVSSACAVVDTIVFGPLPTCQGLTIKHGLPPGHCIHQVIN